MTLRNTGLRQAMSADVQQLMQGDLDVSFYLAAPTNWKALINLSSG